MRIVSLLPAATEILYGIGAGGDVVGVTHECDFPQEARGKPALIRPRIDPGAPPGEIDRQVAELLARGESIYAVDAELLARLAPDLIVTQDLCHVCAASPEDLGTALARLPAALRPRVVNYSPHGLAGVWRGIREIGAAAGRAEAANTLADRLERELAGIERAVAGAARGTNHRPRVLCLEWFDPPYFGGHWVPEMVRLAGGADVIGREGEPSVAVPWPAIAEGRPEVIVLMPCGYNLERNLDVWRSMRLPECWESLPAVQAGRVFAVDGNAYFSRSGPRLVQGTALLAALLHPECAIPGEVPEYRRVGRPKAQP